MKKSYDTYTPHAQRPGTFPVTIGYLKKEREAIKDMRRAANGLPPKSKPIPITPNTTIETITYDESTHRP